MIWYLDHSAIAVETNNHLLLFDLFGKTLQPPKEMGLAQGFVNPDELRDKDVVIFVSHEHPDHFDPAIFSLRDRLKRVRFVLPEEFDEIYQGDLFAAPNQTYRLPDMTVTTFESTDIGLAYPGGGGRQAHLPRRRFKLVALGGRRGGIQPRSGKALPAADAAAGRCTGRQSP